VEPAAVPVVGATPNDAPATGSPRQSPSFAVPLGFPGPSSFRPRAGIRAFDQRVPEPGAGR